MGQSEEEKDKEEREDENEKTWETGEGKRKQLRGSKWRRESGTFAFPLLLFFDMKESERDLDSRILLIMTTEGRASEYNYR